MTTNVTTRTARGMTLVELLVVVVIITTLVATAIPILNPTTDNRRMREASRAVNGFLSAAQTRATQIGRPFGVALKRLSQDTGNVEDRAKCLELYYVEQPAPFAGFSEGSVVRLAHIAPSSSAITGYVHLQFLRLDPGNDEAELPPGLDYDALPAILRLGDVVDVNGKRFVIEAVPNALRNALSGEPRRLVDQANQATTDGFLQGFVYTARTLDGASPELSLEYDQGGFRMADLAVTSLAEPFWSAPKQYKILRQPAATSLSPLQLPPGTAIDLQASGLLGVSAFYLPWSSDTVAHINNDQPVVIMFAPEGPVSRIFINQQFGDEDNPSSSTIEQIPSGQVALLIGRGDTPPAVTVGPINDQIDLKDWSTNSQEQMKKVRADHNWLSGDARWVVVGSSTGAVATVENALLDPTKWQNYDRDNSGDVPFAEQIWAATEFVRQSSRVGGR